MSATILEAIIEKPFTSILGSADDLELVSWLCQRIWVLQGNFTAEDGYAAARLSIAEMLKSGTTCFLESMVCLRKRHNALLEADGAYLSLPTGMASTAFVKPWRKAASGDAWER